MQPQRKDPVYDDDDDKPVTRANLRALEGGGETSEPARGHLRDASSGADATSPDRGNFGFNPHGDSGSGTGGKDASAASPEFLRNSETDVAGLGNKKARRGNALKGITDKLRSLSSNKWLVGIGLSSGMLIIILVFVMLIFLGNYKVVQLAEHIADYRFARVSRNYAENVSQITSQDVELSTADKSVLQRASDKFSGVKDKTWGSMWDKINNYRPDEILNNFKQDGTISFEYEDGGFSNLWKKKLVAVTINGERITPAETSRWDKIVHPLQSRGSQLEFSDQVNARLAQAMNGRSAIIRGAVAQSLRDELGVKLQWWKQGLPKYRGLSEEKANALIEAESEKTISGGIKPSPSEIGAIAEGAQNTRDAIDQCADTASCLDEEVKNGGKLPSGAITAIDNAVSADIFQKAIAFVNPVYAVSLPVCLVYDGSLSNSGSGQKDTVNNVSTQDQRTFYAIETAADQQKNGSKVNGEAAGAMAWKVGDIQKSIPEQRAAGSKIDTSSELQPQSNSNGTPGNTVSIFSFLPTVGGLADSVASSACPLVTNLWFGGAVGVGSLIAGFFSGGTSQIAEQGLARALASYMADFAGQLFTKKEAFKLGLFTAGVEGVTLFAKMQTAQKAAANDNGFSVGPSFDNAGDRGGDLHAQNISQHFYGRPLTNAEVAESNASDQNYRANEIGRESFTQRYFALTNPDSLLTKFGTTLSTHLNGTLFSSLVNLGSRVLNPSAVFASVFGNFNKQVALADGAKDQTNYNILQWGFSNEEEQYIKTHAYFGVLENSKIVNEATYQGQPISDYIDSTYGKCWTESMGQLLTDGSIQRDNTGNVTGGLCSKQNLSFDSVDPASYDPVTGKNDLIFRYRVMKSQEKTIDNQIDYQTLTTDSQNDVTSTSTPGQLPTGDSQQLAQQLLPYIKSGQLFCGAAAGGSGSADCSDIQNTAKGTPLGGNCQVKALTPHLLALILGLVRDDGWKLGISAMCSDHHLESDGPYAGHSYGSVADFSVQNGAVGAAAASDKKFVDDVAALLSTTGGSFGQVGNCHAIYPSQQKSNFVTFTDTCNHQHVRAAP